MKSILLIILIVSSVGGSCLAQEVWGKGGGASYSMAGVEGGFRWSSADLDGASSNKQTLGFQLGASGVFNLAENFGIKTGLFYSERAFKSTFNGTDVKGKITYFDIPVFAMLKFEDYAGVYLGPSFSFKLGDEIDTGSLTDVKGTVIPLTFGAQFKFAPNLGVNVYFETVSGDLAKGVKSSRSVGTNLLITFD